jgi:hypothetical protein
MLTWIWLIPARLLAGGLPVVWCGVILAAHWLPRLVLGQCGWSWPRWLPPLAALLLAPTVAALGFYANPWQIALLLAVQGGLVGIMAASWQLDRWQPQALAESQALAEVVGPVVGVVLWAFAGTPAPFVGGAVAALALSGVSYASSRAARA